VSAGCEKPSQETGCAKERGENKKREVSLNVLTSRSSTNVARHDRPTITAWHGGSGRSWFDGKSELGGGCNRAKRCQWIGLKWAKVEKARKPAASGSTTRYSAGKKFVPLAKSI
jgi:hypothetical protein